MSWYLTEVLLWSLGISVKPKHVGPLNTLWEAYLAGLTVSLFVCSFGRLVLGLLPRKTDVDLRPLRVKFVALIGRGFLPSTSAFPRQYHFTTALYSFLYISQKLYNLSNWGRRWMTTHTSLSFLLLQKEQCYQLHIMRRSPRTRVSSYYIPPMKPTNQK